MKNELALYSRAEIRDYFTDVWQTMQACIDRGLNTEGVLSGPLRMPHCKPCVPFCWWKMIPFTAPASTALAPFPLAKPIPNTELAINN